MRKIFIVALAMVSATVLSFAEGGSYTYKKVEKDKSKSVRLHDTKLTRAMHKRGKSKKLGRVRGENNGKGNAQEQKAHRLGTSRLGESEPYNPNPRKR